MAALASSSLLSNALRTKASSHHCDQDFSLKSAYHRLHLVVSESLAIFDFGRLFLVELLPIVLDRSLAHAVK